MLKEFVLISFIKPDVRKTLNIQFNGDIFLSQSHSSNSAYSNSGASIFTKYKISHRIAVKPCDTKFTTGFNVVAP